MNNLKILFFATVMVLNATLINATSSIYVSNQLYNRDMIGRYSFKGSPYKEMGEIKPFQSKETITVNNPNELSQLKIDVRAGKSKSSTSRFNQPLKFDNILSGTSLKEAEQLVKQNRNVYLNIQEHPGSQAAGVNVLPVSLRSSDSGSESEEESLEDFEFIN